VNCASHSTCLDASKSMCSCGTSTCTAPNICRN
jgi:hypothetical protein